MNKPNILMFHRVQIDDKQHINRLYFQRKMVCDIEFIYKQVNNYLQKGLYFGSIEQCLKNKSYFHLSFDDGFTEHLQVANLLKNKYSLDYNSISFSINVGNSIFKNYTGMDIVYQILSENKIQKLRNFSNIEFDINNIPKIKKYISSLATEKLNELSDYFSEFDNILKRTFLSEIEIIKLSKLFKIISHGITHRFLTSHKIKSKNEIIVSKKTLEKLIKTKIDVFCYPEGKNDNDIQKYCNEAGYKYALSIRHENNNNFCIGREVM